MPDDLLQLAARDELDPRARRDGRGRQVGGGDHRASGHGGGHQHNRDLVVRPLVETGADQYSGPDQGNRQRDHRGAAAARQAAQLAERRHRAAAIGR